MHTFTTDHAETRTISIAAPRSAVLEVVGDPRRLPDWAPEFAKAVKADGDDWLIDTGAGELRLRIAVDLVCGTVDLLRPPSLTQGAFIRVVHNNEGSECIFTLFFPDGTDEAAVAKQMATVEEELRTVRSLCEQPSSLAA